MKLWKKLLLVGLIVLTGGFFVFRDEVSDQIKAWRYRQSIHSAEAALEKNDFNEVAKLTGSAFRLTSGEIGEIRELFFLASAVNSPDCPAIGEKLFNHPDALLDDRLAVLEFVAQRGVAFYVDGMLSRLSEEERQEPRVMAVRIRQLLNEGNRLEALLLMDSLPAEAFDLDSLQLLKGELMALERGNPLAWKSCRILMGGMMTRLNGEEALTAFRVLFLLPDNELKKIDKPNLRTWLKSQPEAAPRDHLAVARWRLLREPGAEEAILSDVLALSDTAPREVARWMLDHRQEKQILEGELDLGSSETYPFFLARLQLYFNQERWKDAHILLENPHRSLSPSLLAGFQAAVAFQQKDDLTRVLRLQEALKFASQSEKFGEFLALFEVGRRMGDLEMQRKTSEALVRLPSRFLPRGEQLSFLDLQFGAEPDFLASLYQKLKSARPDDALIVYRKAILDFIVLGEKDQSLAAIEVLLADYPAADSLRCAKALILSESSASDALAWLEGKEGGNFNLEGSFETAVYAMLLRKNDKVNQAKQLERRIEWTSIPRYIRDYFEKHGLGSAS